MRDIGFDERNGTNTNGAWLYAGLWSDTSAISSITIDDFSGGGYAQYSTFYLYGIKNS